MPRKYDKIIVRVKFGETYLPDWVINDGKPLSYVRTKVRHSLDKFGQDYAQLTCYRGDKAVLITGVRSSRMKHFHVATATIG